MNRPLGGAAVPAGIALFLTAALHAVTPYVIPVPMFTVMLVSDAILAVTAILLVTRRRSAVYAVLFCAAGVVAAVMVRPWFYYSADLPFFATSGMRAFVCICMAIVCLRRANEPKRGPWVLLLIPQILLLAVLIVASFIGSSGQSLMLDETQIHRIFAVAAADEGLMLIALICTGIAFSRAPALPEETAYPEWDVMQPEWEQPQPAYESAVQESAFSQQSGAPAAVQEQPPAPRPQQNASAVQEAVVEILDD